MPDAWPADAETIRNSRPCPGERCCATPQAAREIERLLGADATQTLGDFFEAAETAVRTAILAVAARFVAERLNADHSDQHAAGLPCGCGHTAERFSVDGAAATGRQWQGVSPRR